jgi:hypothetical protein
MTERLSHRPRYLRRTASRSAPTSPHPSPSPHGRDGDLPPPPPGYVAAPDTAADHESTILGFPAEFGEDDDEPGEPSEPSEPLVDTTAPLEVVALRYPDRVAGTLLVLAGVAANVTLSLPWLRGGSNGLSLVSHGVEVLDDGVGALARSDLWQPLTVVLGGGLLVLLGLGLLVPARGHRLLGLLALVVALATAAAVLVLLAGAAWRVDRFGVGTWFAAAVPVLGVVGALTAMLTPPHVTVAPGR